MIKKSLFGISIVAMALVGCKGGESSGGGGGDVLAIVNGESIPMSDYYRTMERSSVVTAMVDPRSLTVDPQSGQVPPQVARVQIQPSMGLQALRDCVTTTIFRQLAKDEGVYPTPDKVDKEIEWLQKQNQNYVKMLNEQGLSVEQIKFETAQSLARFGLLTKGVEVSQTDVDAFIKNNPDKFMSPEITSLIMIEVADAKTRDLADKELKEGQIFSAVAQHYSIQQDGKTYNYRFPTNEVLKFPPLLKTLVAKTKEFAATGWQQDPKSKHFVNFYVERKVPSKKVNIDDTIKEKVRRALLEEKGKNANDVSKRVSDALKKAKIDIKIKYLADPWKKAFDELTKSEAAAAK